MPNRGVLPTGAYALSSLETVNVENGNIVYRIPLASLPPGPAGWTAGVSLMYNSQIEDFRFTREYSPITNHDANYGRLTGSESGGWQYAFQYRLNLQMKPQDGMQVCDGATEKIYRLSVISADGSHHTLHLYPNTPSDDPSNGEVYTDVGGDGFYDVMPGIGKADCLSTKQVHTGKIVYFTSDSSFLRLEFDYTGQAFDQMPWVLYLSDGRTVTGQGDTMTSLRDRNGNTVSLAKTYDTTFPTILVQDSLQDAVNRVDINYGSGSPDTVVQTGADGTALTSTITRTYVTPDVSLSYECSDAGDLCYGAGGYSGVASLALPTGQQFTFGYDTSGGWGELNDVTLPSGANAHYTWWRHGHSRSGFDSVALENPVASKAITRTDENLNLSLTETTSYCVGRASTGYCTASPEKVTAPDGGVTKYIYTTAGTDRLLAKTEFPDGSTQEKIWNFNSPYLRTSNFKNPYVQFEIRSASNGTSATLAAVRTNTVDRNGNATGLTEGDWIPYAQVTHNGQGVPTGFTSAGSGTVLRTTANTYSVAISGPASSTTTDVNGYWDPSMMQIWGLPTNSQVTGTGAGSNTHLTYTADAKKNLLTEEHWDSSASVWRVTTYGTDSYGNVTSTLNPRGFTSSATYDSAGRCLTGRVMAVGQSDFRTFSSTCSGNSWGLTGTQTDDHGITRTLTYDKFGRNILTVEAGTGFTRNRRTIYSDTARTVETRGDFHTTDDGLLRQTTYYDQLGQVRQTMDAAGSKVTSSYQTPATGANAGFTYQLVSNPFVTHLELTSGWTLTKLDRNGRVISVVNYAAPLLPAPWGTNGGVTGTETTTYGWTSAPTSASTISTSRENNSGARRNELDGLGRIIRVAENGFVTATYGYDVLDNLTSVFHAVDATHSTGETRSFSYNSLAQLTSAVNPENGTIGYVYNANGGLETRTQAGVTSTYAYNPLDELTGVSYSDSGTANPTPWVARSYVKSRPDTVSAGNTSTHFTYDGLGRVAASTQTTNSQPYVFGYTWNLADGVETETYPSGRVVTTGYDSAGRAMSVMGSRDGVTTSYAGSVLYAAAGPMTQMGGGDGILRTYVYNTRIQPTSITATLGATTLLNLGLNFPTSANNGNLPSETITRPGFSATQSFGYDFKNRLTSATEGSNWTQNYKFDLEGNMAMGAGSAVIASSLTPQTNNSTTVPFNNANQWSGATYTDGNMTFLAGQTLAYDAEQRMRQWSTTGPPASTVTFGYDGDGKRTTKVNGSQSAVFVYDAFGSLAAEYGGPALSIVGTLYMTRDHLGSTRMVTNASGVVVGCHDYLPFGEEVPQSWGRSSVSCYGQMGEVADKFTGQVRDSETGYDYFGARYFGAAQGRFATPDPIGNVVADRTNPQSWNMYSYVWNNPMINVDPTGTTCVDTTHADGTGGHADDGDGKGCAAAGVSPTKDGRPPRKNDVSDLNTYVNTFNYFDPKFNSDPNARSQVQEQQGLGQQMYRRAGFLAEPLCSGGAFLFIGGGAQIPGIGVHAEAYALPIDYESGKGFSSGIIGEARLGTSRATELSIGGEASISWKTGKRSYSGLAFASREVAGGKMGPVSVGLLGDTHGNVGFYGGEVVGLGVYGHPSFINGCGNE